MKKISFKTGIIVASVFALSLIIIAAIFIFRNNHVNSTKDIGKIKPLDLSTVVNDPESNMPVVNNQILIVFKDNVNNNTVDSKIAAINGKIVGYLNGFNDYQVEIQGNPTLDKLKTDIQNLKQDSNIESANLNGVYSQSGIPNDPWDGTQLSWNDIYPGGSNWGLNAIEAPLAWASWDFTNNKNNVKIGIIDSGFDISHEDLMIPSENAGGVDGNYKQDNPTTTNAANYFSSDNHHGTVIAGIIGAISDNGKGISGVVKRDANNKDLYVYKYDSTDYGIEYGVLWNLSKGVKVINISQGISYENKTKPSEDNLQDIEKVINFEKDIFEPFLQKIIDKGYDFLIIQSAGNDGIDAKYAGIFCSVDNSELKKHIIIVGAIKNVPDGANAQNLHTGYNIADYSNLGDKIDIVAPGSDIFSTMPGNKYDSADYFKTSESKTITESNDGTSFAAPYVTGVAALVWDVNPKLSAEQVKNIIVQKQKGDIVINYKGKDYKILNAKSAVDEAKSSVSSTSSSSSSQSSSSSGNIADGTYPICVTNASVDNGTCYLKYRMITTYDMIWDYIEKVTVLQGNSSYYDMNKYFESNYPVTEYKDGKTNQIPIQNMLTITGMSKSELLEKLNDVLFGNDNCTFYYSVNDNELQNKINNNCDISVSGSLSTQDTVKEKITPQELVNRINTYQDIKYSDINFFEFVSIDIKNSEIVIFKDPLNP